MRTPTRIRGGDEADLEVNSTAGGSPPASILLFDGEEENNSSNDLNDIQAIASLEKKKILNMLVHSVEDDVYTAKVNSVLKLNLVAKFIAIIVSFCQASKLYHSVKEETGMGSLGSVTDHEVGHLCRIVCAAISSTSRSSSTRRYRHYPSDLMLETTQVPRTLTFDVSLFQG